MRCYWYTERDTACPGRAWKPGYFHIIIIWSSLWARRLLDRFPQVTSGVSPAQGQMFQFPGSERNSVMEREIWTSPHTHHHHFSKVDPNFVYNKKYRPADEEQAKQVFGAAHVQLVKRGLFCKYLNCKLFTHYHHHFMKGWPQFCF